MEAEVKLDIQQIRGRDGEKQARIKLAMTRVVRLCQAKQNPSKGEKSGQEHGLTTISRRGEAASQA